MATYQVLVKLLDGRTQCLQVPTPTVSGEALKSRIFPQVLIPSPFIRLVTGTLEIRDETLISATADDRRFPSLTVLLRLRGGKGGFGSLLRGAATKAGQKKTNNFDACRDMSGRRLRHVNAEKRLEEWKAEAADRKLEKLAEDFLKKKAKEFKKGKGKNGEVEKYLEKYREDSAKCMEAVEESVRQSFGLYKESKRKVLPATGMSSSKRLKIWIGKQTVDGSDSDDDDDDDEHKDNDGNDGGEEKSVVLDGNCPNQSKEDGEASALGLASGSNLDGESSSGCSEYINLEELRGKSLDGQSSPGCSEQSNLEEANGNCSLRSPAIGHGSGTGGSSSESDVFLESETRHTEVSSTQNVVISILEELPEINEVKSVPEINEVKSVLERNEVKSLPDQHVKSDFADKEPVVQTTVNSIVDEPFSFDKYNSAAELEVLGMERLKVELQSHGLKCGGTLQERAARLFLLKTTPLDKLPKKVLAAKAAGK